MEPTLELEPHPIYTALTEPEPLFKHIGTSPMVFPKFEKETQRPTPEGSEIVESESVHDEGVVPRFSIIPMQELEPQPLGYVGAAPDVNDYPPGECRAKYRKPQNVVQNSKKN